MRRRSTRLGSIPPSPELAASALDEPLRTPFLRYGLGISAHAHYTTTVGQPPARSIFVPSCVVGTTQNKPHERCLFWQASTESPKQQPPTAATVILRGTDPMVRAPLPSSRIVNAEHLDAARRTGRANTRFDDDDEPMRRPGSLGLMRARDEEEMPRRSVRRDPERALPVKQIMRQADTEADELREHYLQIRRELFDDDEDEAAAAMPVSAAWAAQSSAPRRTRSRTRCRYWSTLSAKSDRPEPLTWAEHLRQSKEQSTAPPASTRVMRESASATSLDRSFNKLRRNSPAGSAAPVSSASAYASSTSARSASAPRAARHASPMRAPSPPSSPEAPRTCSSERTLVGEPGSRNLGTPATASTAFAPAASSLLSWRGTGSAIPYRQNDLERELMLPRNLAARAAWTRHIANTEARGSPSAIAAGRVPLGIADEEEEGPSKLTGSKAMRWHQARPVLEEAARGANLGSGEDWEMEPIWTRDHQEQLNELNERARFFNMLERFEEFARVRSATLRPAAWFSSLETNDLRPRPRRAWGSPQWPRPPDILDTNNYSLSNPGVRRASEYSPETGRRRSS